METSETVLLRVKIDYAESVKQSAEFAQQISVAKDNLKAIEVQSGKTSEAYIAQQQEIKALEAQQRSINKSIQDSIKVNKASGDSYNALSGEVSLLTAKYRAMSEADRKTASGKALQKDIFEKTEKLKELDASMNVYSRNVGNYSQAFRGFLDNLKVGGVNIGNITGSLKQASEGFSTGTAGATSFRAALISTGIGAFVVAAGAILTVFTKLTPVVDKVEQIMGGIGNTFNVIVNRAQSFLNGDFEKAFSGFGDEISQAYNAGVELTKVLQDLDDLRRGAEIQNARANKQVEELILLSRNRTASEKERMKLLQDANKIEEDNFKSQQELKQRELNLLTAQAIQASKLNRQELQQLVEGTLSQEIEYKKRGNLSDELLNKLKDAQIAVINGERESINLRTKLQNRFDQLQQESAKKRDEEAKKQLEIQQKLTEELLKVIDKRASEADKAEQEIIRKRAEAYAEQQRLDKKKYAEELIALSNSSATKEEYEKKKAAIEDEYLKQQMQTNRQFYESTIDLELEAAQRKLEIKSKQVADKQRLDQAEIESAVAVANASGQLINQLAAVAEQGSEIQKFLALSNVAVNLGTAIGNLVATSSAPTPDNLITGGIAGFVKYAAGLTQILSAIGQARSIIGGAAAGGGDFMTKGPTLLLVGDNPGGVERVTVEPVSGRGQTRINPAGNLVAMAGGGTLTTYGGYAERRSGFSPMIDYGSMAEQISKIKIFTKITEIEKVSSRKASIAKISQL